MHFDFQSIAPLFLRIFDGEKSPVFDRVSKMPWTGKPAENKGHG
jgi:hypothetical protein